MKKIVLIIVNLVVMQLLWSQVTIKSDVKKPFVNEVIEIIASVPGTDLQAPTKLKIDGTPYKIIESQISENFSFNEITNKTESSIGYKFFIRILKPGITKISFKVENSESEELILDIIPLKLTSDEIPYLHSFINSKKLYRGEHGYAANYIIFDKYRDSSYRRPFIDMDVTPLYTYYKRKIFIDDNILQYKVISAFSFSSDTTGTYIIPQSEIIFDNVAYPIPSYNIEIVDLPKNIPEESLIGKSLKLSVIGLKDLYRNGQDVSFSIEVAGDVNLSKLDSLKNYFNIPDFLTEEISFKRDDFKDSEMLSIVNFKYSGRLNSFVGFNLKNIKLPLFNTETEVLEYISLPNKIISGSIPITFLYAIIFIGFIIILTTILFTIKFISKKSEQLEFQDKNPAEIYNFSKRENEIFIILVNGKTTKEIADELSISPETVKKHIQNILKKTSTNSRLELLALINSIK